MNDDSQNVPSADSPAEDSPKIRFADLGLPEPVLRALTDCGYEYPTPIQAQAIPQLLAGHDLIGGSQTGTGKTAAFLLPILAKLHLKKVAELAQRDPDASAVPESSGDSPSRAIPMAADGEEGYSLSEPAGDNSAQPGAEGGDKKRRKRPRRRRGPGQDQTARQDQAHSSEDNASSSEASRDSQPRQYDHPRQRQQGDRPRHQPQHRSQRPAHPQSGGHRDHGHREIPRPVVLILEPTRELATQVFEAFNRYAKYLNVKAALLYGGVGYGLQRQQLNQGADIIIATPGRLMDLVEQRSLSLKSVDTLVLDEADRMLDMGFMPAVRKIVSFCPKDRQSLLFSATLPPEIVSLAQVFLRNPVEIKVGGGASPAETISHALYPVDERQKFDLLRALLEHLDYKSVLIFTRMKIGADIVSRWLENHGHAPVAVLHADRSQKEREQALNDFKSGKCEILVATDIVARGIDISGITHVINYDVPQHPEDYVHRIGRTGRAKRDGDAVTLFTATEVEFVAAIERFIKQRIERKKLPDFPYNWTPILEDRAPVKKKRNRGFQRPGA